MAITTGTRFNHYEILTRLGAGGMGEVYRAKDTRLDREVAIKVLPADFANDADRLKRFEQEARATSALNHPNILTIYDIGNYEGVPFIVAELLDGEELRAQLDEGALPMRKAIDYAQKIAAGLAAAHDKGIVHRDLKPENLFVTKDGRVKILDFGLAKLKPQKFGVGEDSEAPTMKPLTDPGVVMGTVGYMSPEQVRGQLTDHRSDIFSLGLILYEMVTGRRAFQGESLAETMSAIVKEEPPEMTESNPNINPTLERIVRRCLEKKPDRRFQSTADLGFALESLSGPSSSSQKNMTTAVGTIGPETDRSPWLNRIPWAAALLLLISCAVLAVLYLRRPALEAEPMQLSITPLEKATRIDQPAISPDGRMLAFVAASEGKTQLWVRPLNSSLARPLVEVNNIGRPFWSPDSQFLCYVEYATLKKIALAGGKPESLGTTRSYSGTWNRDGVILFQGENGISRIPASGGAVSSVTTIDPSRGELSHDEPVFLPDGSHFLFMLRHKEQTKTGIWLASLDGGELKQILPLGETDTVLVVTNPMTTGDGYLVYSRQGGLLAQAYDFSRNRLTGEPVRLAEQVEERSRIGSGPRRARFSAANGVIVMMDGKDSEQLTWLDRAGRKLGTVGAVGRYGSPSLSPNDQLLVVEQTDPQTRTADIRLFDLARDTELRFTVDPGRDEDPIWSPDGSRLVWSSSREGGGLHLYLKAGNGAGQDELLLKTRGIKRATDWSADGRFILYQQNTATGWSIWVFPLEGERKPWPWLNRQFDESNARFSPDGKWIAYKSNESGRFEIYLQAFVPGSPASGAKQKLSTNGGERPEWRRNGRELYYLAADDKLMAVEMTLGPTPKSASPKELFRIDSRRQYAPTGDGQRFLFVTDAEDATKLQFTVLLNWMAELKK